MPEFAVFEFTHSWAVRSWIRPRTTASRPAGSFSLAWQPETAHALNDRTAGSYAQFLIELVGTPFAPQQGTGRNRWPVAWTNVLVTVSVVGKAKMWQPAHNLGFLVRLPWLAVFATSTSTGSR